MKRRQAASKNKCKKPEFLGKKNYTHLRQHQNRMNAAFWGRYATRNCAKESSHDGAIFLQSDGDKP